MITKKGRRSAVRRAAPILLSLPLLMAGCASTGATYGSGVGEALLEGPPYYAGRGLRAVADSVGTIGYFPVLYQQGSADAPIFDPSLGPQMQALLVRMTLAMDSLSGGPRLAEGGRVSAVTHQSTLRPPDVQFGCGDVLDLDCEERPDGALGRGSEPLRLTVGRPSAEWVAWAGDLMSSNGSAHALVVTLEVGQYFVRQRGFAGTKEVALGTGHVASLPWLTSLEGAVSVLQLTGALIRPDGTAVRIGAEGLMVRRTRLLVSAIGGQELISDEDVARLATAKRDDLPGSPLVWEVGLRNLVGQLVGTPPVLTR